MPLLIAILAAWSSTSPQIIQMNVKWEDCYLHARQVGMRERKPLAIFVGRGQDGWKQVVRGGSLNAEARRQLQDRFLPVYIDAETESGQKLAEAFEIANKRGFVVSDRTGELMAFHHDGDLALADLVKHLNRLGDPDHIVVVTETNDAPVAAPVAPAGGYANPFACLT